MYYTDGFANEKTYFGRGHIWHFELVCDAKEYFFFCVFESESVKEPSEVERVLKLWVQQILPYALKNGVIDMQRELNRFGAWLKKWCATKADFKEPTLYLIFRDNIYSNKKKEGVFARYRGHRGVVYNKEGETCIIKEELFGSDKTAEEIANRLKTDMLVAMSKGMLEQGYFIIWENADDF